MADNNKEKPKRCFMLPPHPNLVSGWACCNCRTFNADERHECKWCNHNRCDKNPANQVS